MTRIVPLLELATVTTGDRESGRRCPAPGQPDPAGEATARVLGGYRRTAADRGRGQAAPLSADGLAAILATADRPRTDGRGVESHTTAQRRGRTDAVIAGLLFMGVLRRSEVSALEWRDVSDASDGDGVLITVRTSKTNQEGDTADVRYLKNGAANAIRTVRADRPDAAPTDRPACLPERAWVAPWPHFMLRRVVLRPKD